MHQLTIQHCVMQGTNVPVLVGEAILATDKRHCAALSATLRGGQHQAMASFLRYVGVLSPMTLCSLKR